MQERRLVFISHANPEDNEFTSWLGTRLAAAGYEVWSDILNLTGGERFWQDIGDVIKKETAAFVVALSHASYKKDGVLDEIALAVNTGRKHELRQFVIPIRLDDLPYADFPEQLIRLNAIDFSTNWADGLSILLSTLSDIRIPKATTDSGGDFDAWRKFRLLRSAVISSKPEMLLSNWFSINSLPSHIYFTRFNALQETVERAFGAFRSPATQHLRLAASFANVKTLQEETPDIPLEHAYCVQLSEFLVAKSEIGPNVSWLDARNIVTALLHKAWDQFARSRGLSLCEFAHGVAWFVPLNLIEGNIATFQDENGEIRRRRLVGRSAKRGVYWHYAVSAKVSLTSPQHLALRNHIVFTHDGQTPLESSVRSHRLRRSFCKNWWNDRWRDLLRAFACFLANGREEFYLSLGGDAVASIAACPLALVAPYSINNDLPLSHNDDEHLESETGVDALIDPQSEPEEDGFGVQYYDADDQLGQQR